MNEHPDEEVNQRIKKYWEERLDDISKESEKHIEEAIGLTDWIIDSPFSNVDTLKLIHKTLQITKGQIDRYSNIDDSINILCEYGREFCLIVLECIQMILTNEHNKYLDVYSKNFESSLNKFLDEIVKNESDKTVLQKAIDLVDDLGRLHVYNYAKFYDPLNEKLKS